MSGVDSISNVDDFVRLICELGAGVNMDIMELERLISEVVNEKAEKQAQKDEQEQMQTSEAYEQAVKCLNSFCNCPRHGITEVAGLTQKDVVASQELHMNLVRVEGKCGSDLAKHSPEIVMGYLYNLRRLCVDVECNSETTLLRLYAKVIDVECYMNMLKLDKQLQDNLLANMLKIAEKIGAIREVIHEESLRDRSVSYNRFKISMNLLEHKLQLISTYGIATLDMTVFTRLDILQFSGDK